MDSFFVIVWMNCIQSYTGFHKISSEDIHTDSDFEI